MFHDLVTFPGLSLLFDSGGAVLVGGLDVVAIVHHEAPMQTAVI